MRHRIFFFVMVLVLSACSTPQGITPIQPELGHYSPTVVESLNPNFRWKPVSDPDMLYDLAIFESSELRTTGKIRILSRGT